MIISIPRMLQRQLQSLDMENIDVMVLRTLRNWRQAWQRALLAGLLPVSQTPT